MSPNSMTPDRQSTPGKQQKANWLLLPALLSPAILSLTLGLIVQMLPRERVSDVCSAFISQTLTTSINLMSPVVREIVFPCSVLAVQASVVMPLAFLIVVLVIRRHATHNRYVGPKPNFFVFLFAAGVTYLLWVDLFLVGLSYEMAVIRPFRSFAVFRWFLITSFTSLAAVTSAGWLTAMTYRTVQALITKSSR